MHWMDRWATYEQRRSDARFARWEHRQRERARTGRMTLLDRWAAYEQRRSDRLLAASNELYQLRPQLPDGPVHGPDGSTAVFKVELAGFWWLRWWRNAVPGGPLAPLLLACLLISAMIWRLVFHRAYVVHIRTNGEPAKKLSVRLADEVAAYRVATQLARQFQAEGAIALQRPYTDAA